MLARIPGFRPGDFGQSTVLIEMTAKRWKAWQVVSAGLTVIGLLFIGWQLWAGLYQPLMSEGFASGPAATLGSDAFLGPAGIIGIIFMAAALGVGVYARFMAWWHHG